MANKKSYNPLTVFICTHKPFKIPQFVDNHPEIYKIITNCDETFPKTKVDVLRVNKMKTDYGQDENTCLNEWRMINAIYNMKVIPEYVGICHYRRYFDPQVIERLNMRVLNDCGYDLVLGKPVVYNQVVKEEHDSLSFYGYWHNYKDFLTLGKVIEDVYPDMKEPFERMSEQEFLYNSAMMILKRDDFIDLCDFNFSIYDELKKVYGIKNDIDALEHVKAHREEYVKPYNPYYDEVMQSRILGYLLERSTGTWLQEKDENGLTRIDKAAELEWFMPKPEDIEIQ